MKSSIQFNRRGFLKSSVLGTAGALISTSAAGKPLLSGKSAAPIVRRKLGNTGIELPVVSFGVMRSDSANLVKAAYDMGCVHFDTASSYMNGRNEQMLGDVFKDIPRESIVVSTKIRADIEDANAGTLKPGAQETLMNALEESLKRLQMDYVDIFYIHDLSTRNMVLSPELQEILARIKKEGKARVTGLSTHNNEPEAIQAVADSDVYDVVLTSYNFNHQRAAEIKEKIAIAASRGKGVIAMKTMAGGFLDSERQRPVNCTAALKWVLQDPNIHTTIPGMTTFDMLNENYAVMENLQMTPEEFNHIEEAKTMAGIYCGGCNECTMQCKKHLPVHEIMRAYMYAYGYRNFENAYSVLDEFNISANPCSDCDSCSVSCPRNVMVNDRIAGVCSLRQVPRNMLV